MKHRIIKWCGYLFCSAVILAVGCGQSKTAANTELVDVLESDTDFSKLRTPGSQEAAYAYNTYFLPEIDGANQPYVGDAMPYYEDGVYYIYYLKDGGDSYNHSIYLVTTEDFVTYKEQDEPVLVSDKAGGQDAWIGTGSVVKVGVEYYFFYTGHSSTASEYKEKIMLAKSNNLTSFEKVEGFEIIPPVDIHQKNDFRDPQGYYDAEADRINLTITASKDGKPSILKYSLSGNLNDVSYDGIIFTETVEKFWNLECSDLFKIGNTWYLTYSGQDDTLWYASSDKQFGPYSKPVRLEGKLFYAPKHVENNGQYYMVGWGRRSESVSSTQDVSAWAGNLVVQKLSEKAPGVLMLEPVEAVENSYSVSRKLLIDTDVLKAESGSIYNYYKVFNCFESFMIKGDFVYEGNGSFGLAFDYNNKPEKYKMISISPANQAVEMYMNEGNVLISEIKTVLEKGKKYSFTYIQDGSVGVFYIDQEAALTVRLYGVSGKAISIFAENNTVEFSNLRQYTQGDR